MNAFDSSTSAETSHSLLSRATCRSKRDISSGSLVGSKYAVLDSQPSRNAQSIRPTRLTAEILKLLGHRPLAKPKVCFRDGQWQVEAGEAIPSEWLLPPAPRQMPGLPRFSLLIKIALRVAPRATCRFWPALQQLAILLLFVGERWPRQKCVGLTSDPRHPCAGSLGSFHQEANSGESLPTSETPNPIHRGSALAARREELWAQARNFSREKSEASPKA